MPDPTSSPSPNDNRIEINQKLQEDLVLDTNLRQHVIVTTTDKIRLCVREYKEALRARNAWVAPATTALALLASLLTADFKSFLGIEGDVWQAIFIAFLLLSLVWLIKSLVGLWMNRPAGEDDFIDNLKQSKIQSRTTKRSKTTTR